MPPRKPAAVQGQPVAWREVLVAVQDLEARSGLTARIRAAGFTADDVAHSNSTRKILCEALVQLGDKLELEASRAMARVEMRAAIRSVRRRLELELWP